MARVYSMSAGKFIDKPETGVEAGGGFAPSQGAWQRAAIMDLLQTGGKSLSKIKSISEMFKPIEKPAEERKAELKMKTLSSSLDVLEKNLKQVEIRGPTAGRLAFISKLTGGAIYPEVGDYEALRKGLIGPVARAISGEVGVLTDKDIARAEQLLPKVSDTPGLAKRKLDNLRELIAKRTTGKEVAIPGIEEGEVIAPTPTEAPTRIPQFLQTMAGIAPVAGAMAGRAALPIPGVGAGMGAVGGMRVAGALRGEQPTLMQKLTGGVPIPATRGELGAGGVTGLLDLLFRGAGGLMRRGGPKGIVSRARETAAVKAQKKVGGVSATKIAKAGEKFLKAHPEAKSKAMTRLIEGLKKEKTLSVPEVVERTKVWNQAYTSLGKVGKSMKAGVYDKLARAAKAEITRVAPEVAKRTGQLRFLYQAPRAAGKAAWTGIKAGALMRLLRGGF